MPPKKMPPYLKAVPSPPGVAPTPPGTPPAGFTPPPGWAKAPGLMKKPGGMPPGLYRQQNPTTLASKRRKRMGFKPPTLPPAA